MKTTTRFLLVLLVIVGALVVRTALGADANAVKSKYPNLFVVKVDKAFEGATVEVYYSNGDLVLSQKLEKRKMIIDFCDTKMGVCTIRVVKGNEKQEYSFIKK